MANTVSQHLSKLTYEQLGNFLESLLLSQKFKPSQEFSRSVAQELEQRQKSLLSSSSESQQEMKLQIQDCVKIY